MINSGPTYHYYGSLLPNPSPLKGNLMAMYEDLQPSVFEMSDEELGLTPASRYAQLRHDANRHLRGVKRVIRRAKRT